MSKKVYLFLDNYPETVLEELFNWISKVGKERLSLSFFFKKFRWLDFSSNCIKETLALEALLFLQYLYKLWFSLPQISFEINTPRFILNDDIYFIRNGEIQKVDKNDVYGFFSIRGGNWNYPFFIVLNELWKKYKFLVSKSNKLNWCVPYKWKFYALKDLYLYRKELVWDIAIPYKIYSDQDLDIFLNFIKFKFWDEIICKIDNTQVWNWVHPYNLNNTEKLWKLKSLLIKYQKSYLQEAYLVPYYDLVDEYRVYFNKIEKDIKIYSLKKKKVLTSKDKILEVNRFTYWEVVKLKWEYIPKSQWEGKNSKYKFVINKALEYLKLLNYDTGSLEFWIARNWQFVFFEVNSMSDPVCIDERDVEDMVSYYTDLFNNILQIWKK